MKKLFLLAFILLINYTLFAEGTKEEKTIKYNTPINPNGIYIGTLFVTDTVKLPIIFEFNDDKIFFSSPTQGANDLEISYTIDKDSNISINAPQFGFSLIGKFETNKIVGTFYQNGLEIKITLYKEKNKSSLLPKRLQNITRFKYKREDVKITNPTNDRIYYGTYTIPNNPKSNTAILFITGSGIQDRNEEISFHKPFLVISDYLTNNGYYTLRCDDWGFNGEDASKDTTLTIVNDIKAQIKYLKDVKKVDKIILLGHSEGALIAQILANSVDSIILLASPAVDGKQIYAYQLKHALSKNHIDKDNLDNKINEVLSAILDDNLTDKEKREIAIPFFKSLGNDDKSAELTFKTLNLPWYKTFFKLDPKEYIKKIKVPTLVLQGSLDKQVDEKLNIPVFKELLQSENKIIIYPQYNHLFQKCKTGESQEYYEIETTIEENVLEDILYFINSTK